MSVKTVSLCEAPVVTLLMRFLFIRMNTLNLGTVVDPVIVVDSTPDGG